MLGHGAVGRTFRRPHRAAHHRLDRPRRLGVGRHAVRRAPRRPEGVRVRDALRRGLGPLRRVRPVLDGHGRRRSRTCSTVSSSAPVPYRRRTAGRRGGETLVGTKLDALRAEIALRAAGRGGLQRRSRLGARGPGRHRGARARAACCVSPPSPPSLAPEELADCRALAREWGLRWRTVSTDELDDPAYAANDADRCYHCKASLLARPGAAGRGRVGRRACSG